MTTSTAYEDTRDALRAAPSPVEHIVSITGLLRVRLTPER